jgi:hypothetical protein
LGKTLEWPIETNPPFPIDSFNYELQTRNEIITMKELNPTDVAFIVTRVDWKSGTIYDQYDDHLCDELDGIDLFAGGYGYSDVPTVTITGGGGEGATAQAIVVNGVVLEINMLTAGRGYVSMPTVTITGGGGTGCEARGILSQATSGVNQVEQANMTVLTDDYNVYKCLDNNKGARSTYKPIGTTVDPVIMPDGYMWKYLYSIPIALRNKFLTDTYMPIITALREQFYSNGNIQTINIKSSGKNYNFASITVAGDGYLEADPLFITGTTISNPGSGYTSGANVTFDAPFSSNAWQAGNGALLGQVVNYNNNLYRVTLPGAFDTPAPTHTAGTVSSGTAALEYIGTTVTGTVNITSGVVTSISLKGALRDVIVGVNGSGYTSAPQITVSGGGGTGATAIAVMQGTGVSQINVTAQGNNYTSTPTIIVGTQWTASTAYTVGRQISAGGKLYTVTTAGTTSTSAPTHTSGVATNGTVGLTYAGTAASATAELRYGAGYSSLPKMLISPVSGGSGATGYCSGVKSEALLIPIVENGQLTGVQINNGGVGYTYANLNVVGDGTGAQVTADLSPGDVSTLQANTELLTADGRIMSTKVLSGGFGYASATVVFDGDGSGASATATVENGAVTKINMVNYGTGYRWATATIVGNGFGANARVIITPFGGHGKNSINGLYANSLMFYTNISKDTNQGFNVNNDFRQIGLIKNPRQYGNTYGLNSALASACWVITGSINVNQFEKDMVIYLAPRNTKFRIVSLTPTSALIQSLDNDIPTSGAIFSNSNSNTFGVTGVTPPTVDKYSGDLMFIDNKQAFTPTADQTVTLRTVIKF